MDQWSKLLIEHIDELRYNLKRHRTLWPEVTQLAKVGYQTVRRFAANDKDYRNPCVQTLVAIAQALADAVSHQEVTTQDHRPRKARAKRAITTHKDK